MSTEAAAVDSAGGPVVKEKKRKKKLSFPTAFTILFVLTIIAVIATWFVPAGQYAKLKYVADSNVLTVTSPQGADRHRAVHRRVHHEGHFDSRHL